MFFSLMDTWTVKLKQVTEETWTNTFNLLGTQFEKTIMSAKIKEKVVIYIGDLKFI